ncbi:MAG: heterodisulfide reductase-related iron-sulfur binding cluster [Nitrososphaerales archaeon]
MSPGIFYSSLRELEENERPDSISKHEKSDPLKFPQNRYSATNVISSLFLKPDDKFWIDDPAIEPEQKDYVLYIGCNVLQTPFLLLNCVNVLKKMGIDIAVVGGTNLCCGSPLLAAGKIEAAESFDRKRMNFFSKFKPKVVIEWDESCNEFTHLNTLRYMRPEYEIESIEKFIADNLQLCDFQTVKPAKIAIHDHYGHDARSIADFESPRKVLSAIHGVEIVEMVHARQDGLECGYDLLSRDKKAALAANEMVLREAKEAGAGTFLVVWQACYRMFARTEVTHGIKTRHFIDLVAEALGFSRTFEDKYKECKITGDVDQVLIEARENIEANGYAVQEIRPYVEKYLFGIDRSFR